MSFPVEQWNEPSGRIAARRIVAEPVAMRGSVSVSFLATNELTGGKFGLFRWEMGSEAGGPEPHFHRTFSESFYVLDGEVDIHDGRAWSTAVSGDYVYVPEGGVHGFKNRSTGPASMLILFSPGATRQDYFLELSEIARDGRTPSHEEWLEIWARHDQYPA